MTMTMTRETDTRAELNHSCTSQCPNPCPAASSALDRPEIDIVSPATA